MRKKQAFFGHIVLLVRYIILAPTRSTLSRMCGLILFGSLDKKYDKTY